MDPALSQAIRRQLASFRQSLPAPQAAERRDASRTRTDPPREAAAAGWLDRGEVVCNEAGEHLLMRIPVEELWPAAARVLADRRAAPARPTAAEGAEPELARMAAALPHATLLLDLETCGLSGSAIFLIGLLRYLPRGLHVELLLARSYAEEGAILASLRERMPEYRCLVTFNGKSFDWPMVRDRSILHRLAPDQWRPPDHCDLLHHARRRWRRVLPNCRLQTLETYVCGRHRTGDVPGSEIPDVYHDYVRSGRTDRLTAVLLHNALDLVTLLDLALRFASSSTA